jgi:hypothetical protein
MAERNYYYEVVNAVTGSNWTIALYDLNDVSESLNRNNPFKPRIRWQDVVIDRVGIGALPFVNEPAVVGINDNSIYGCDSVCVYEFDKRFPKYA